MNLGTPALKQQFIEQFLLLPPADRQEVASLLLDVLDQTPLHPEWEREIARRSEALDRGELELLDEGEVLRQLKERYSR